MKIVILADEKSLPNIPGGKTSLLRGSFDMFASKYPKEDIVVQCPYDVAKKVNGSVGVTVQTEPSKRGTAPAVGLAVNQIAINNPDEFVAIAYSDHPVSYKKNLLNAIDTAVSMNKQLNRLILIGVNPTFASCDYGYVKIGGVLQEIGSSIAFEMIDFVEKPDKHKALELLQSWRYLWNTGYMVAKASQLVDVYKDTLPDVYQGLKAIGESAGTKVEDQVVSTIYESFPKISIDKGIYEKIDKDKVAVMPVDLKIDDFSDFS